MERTEKLLRLLADGQFHSGESLAESLAVSRAAIWKMISKIKSWQLAIYSVRGRGYQIPGGLELIDEQILTEQLKAAGCQYQQIRVLTSTESTANYIAKEWRNQPGFSRVCIAEHQTAGRGRKGRAWISPFAANLYFSVGLELPLGLSALGGLSLAIGMSLADMLSRYTNQPIKIKWPNDLLVDDKKLAGILVEASGDTNDNSFLNIGVGINWDMQPGQGADIDQPWINLKPLLKGGCSRNQILTQMLVVIEQTTQNYQVSGFAQYASQWPSLSAMMEKSVILHLPNDWVSGTEVGVEGNGALRLQTDKGVKIFHSGEVSLRRQSSNKEFPAPRGD